MTQASASETVELVDDSIAGSPLVLFVDVGPEILEQAKRLLGADFRLGSHLLGTSRLVDAGHSKEAIDVLEKSGFDLALADLSSIGEDGLAFLDRAREVQPNLPVVALAGSPRMREEAVARGAIECLSPRWIFREILAVVEDVLSRGGHP